MITWDEIKDLPKEHPLYIAFMEQCDHECGCYSDLSEEETKEYFERYIDSDKK